MNEFNGRADTILIPMAARNTEYGLVFTQTEP